jgi:hypothetical protein
MIQEIELIQGNNWGLLQTAEADSPEKLFF